MGRRHQGGAVVDPLGECLGRDGHAVVAGHELDLEVRARQPLVADGREVEGADQDLVPARGQGQAGGQRGQGHRHRWGDCGRARRGVEQAPDPGPETLQQRQPVGEPYRGALGVPVLGVALERRSAGAGEGAE